MSPFTFDPRRPEVAAAVESPVAEDAVVFARERLGFDPDEHQARVLRSEAKRGILNCSRQWGKSTTAAAKAVHRAYTRPDSLVLVASPSVRQSDEFLHKAARMVRKLGLTPRGDGGSDCSLVFPNASRIIGLPGNEETVRGFSAVSLLLVDEASRVKDELYEALSPMLAVGGGELWLMSTPAGKRGFFYSAWAHGGTRWERVSVPATECERIPKDFLEAERASMGDAKFRREFMCEFVDRGAGVFDRDLIERALTETVRPLNLGWRMSNWKDDGKG